METESHPVHPGGRPRIFETPEDLQEAANEYFLWCDEHPWIKKDFIKGGEMAGVIIDLPIPRPYTIEGLCIHLDISRETFDNYSKEPPWAQFFDTCSRVRRRIEAQYLEGGMSGQFNASICAMKLGLQQKIAQQHTLTITPMDEAEAAEIKRAQENAAKD